MLKFLVLFAFGFSCIALAAVIPTTPNLQHDILTFFSDHSQNNSLNETQKEAIELLVCIVHLKMTSKCFDKLPDDMVSNNTIYKQEMAAHPAKYCCPVHSSIICVEKFLEHTEPCKTIFLSQLKKGIDDAVKDLTDKYHCQLKSCGNV